MLLLKRNGLIMLETIALMGGALFGGFFVWIAIVDLPDSIKSKKAFDIFFDIGLLLFGLFWLSPLIINIIWFIQDQFLY